jgi:hypothetical protein
VPVLPSSSAQCSLHRKLPRTRQCAELIKRTSLHILDSSLSLLLTLATSALAYPTTRSFAMVLLQTAPPPSSAQMQSLRQSLRSISDDRRILGIGSTRVWMIDSTSSEPASSKSRSNSIANTVSIDESPPSSPDQSSFRRKSSTNGSMMGSTKLSVSVVVHVNDNVGDGDILEVTRYVWNRVSAAVGEGEVGIAVKRGWEGMEVS